jgi:hypothetical protein
VARGRPKVVAVNGLQPSREPALHLVLEVSDVLLRGAGVRAELELGTADLDHVGGGDDDVVVVEPASTAAWRMRRMSWW